MSAAPTLTSTTLPGSLLEVAQLLQAAEKALDPVENKITVTYNTEQETVSIQATLDVDATIHSDGRIKIGAVDYV